MLRKGDGTVADDELSHTEDGTVDLCMLENKIVLGPIRLVMNHRDFTLAGDA